MTELASDLSYAAFLLLAVTVPFLPLRLTLRAAFLAAILFGYGGLLDTPMRSVDRSFGDGLGIVLLQSLSAAVATVLLIRVALAGTSAGSRRHPFDIRASSPRCVRFDQALLAMAGGLAGTAFALGLAHQFAGGLAGRALDLGLALAIAVAAIIVANAVRRIRLLVFPIGGFGAALAAISLVGSEQPRRILAGAETYAAGRPWCLAGIASLPVTAVAQLGFYALPKGVAAAHLTVIVRDGTKFAEASWSIRQQRFVEDFYGSGRTCGPRADYAEALETGRPGSENSSAEPWRAAGGCPRPGAALGAATGRMPGQGSPPRRRAKPRMRVRTRSERPEGGGDAPPAARKPF